MAAITLKLTVTDLADVLAAYTHIRLYRSVTGKGGEYVPLTGPSTDIPLAQGVVSYSFEDLTGDATYFYSSAFVNQQTQSSSPLSEPFGTGIDPALSVLSVQDLKDNFLFGLDLTDAQGNPIPDKFFERYIKAAVAGVESMLDITLAPLVVTNETHDYIQREVNQFYFLSLNHRPVQSVQSYRLQVPGGSPLTFPANWYELQKMTGVVEVVPRSSIALTPQVGFAPYYSQLFYAATRNRIPGGLQVDYVAGFPPGEVPGDILEYVGKQASLGPLRTVGNLLLGAGVAGQSIGIDGLSQSVSLTKQGNGAFAAMVSDYQQDLLALRQVLRGKYHGISLRMA